MNFKIFGKQVKVGESFTKYAELNLFDAVTKFFPNAVSSIVSVSKKNKIFYIIIVLHITKKMEFTAQSNGETAKIAFDSTLEKLSKQLRRYKRKIKNSKHNDNFLKSNVLDAQFQIINEPPSGVSINKENNSQEPLIFAELDTEIEELTVQVTKDDSLSSDYKYFNLATSYTNEWTYDNQISYNNIYNIKEKK